MAHARARNVPVPGSDAKQVKLDLGDVEGFRQRGLLWRRSNGLGSGFRNHRIVYALAVSPKRGKHSNL
jgi:hypothetical protein